MTKTQLPLTLVLIASLAAALPSDGWARGFGGMHGGMGGMPGGMRGGMGGMSGGMRGGMGGMPSGMRGGMGGMPGGMRGGMGGMPGGMRGGMGGMPGGMRGGMGGMPGGMRGGQGMRPGGGNLGANQRGAGNLGGLGAGGANADRSRMGVAGNDRFPGGGAAGFGGNRRDAGAAGLRRGPEAGVGDRAGRGQLGNFLGLPSDGGMHAAAAGNRLGRDTRGLNRFSDDDLRRHGDDVRRDFHDRDIYTRDWYRRYPGAWYPRVWARDDLWAATSWASMGEWLGYANAQPTYYDYGNNVTYQDDSVYVDGQDVGTSGQYYQQAQDLASTGQTAAAGDQNAAAGDQNAAAGDQNAAADDTEQWLPLGVFAMTHDQQTKANLILQLAVNKEGIIRGNYTATLTNDTQPVTGSVDKTTQKAAWTIGDNKDNVIETGIYNLTKDEAPILVHFGKDRTEQWVLVRIKKDDQDDSQTPAAAPQGS